MTRTCARFLCCLAVAALLSACGHSSPPADSTPPPIITAPQITTQPASQTVSVGQSATFSVVATGTAPLKYQWQKNGTAIAAATLSSYTTPAALSGDNGTSFTVTVTNAAGGMTSNAAKL